MFNIRVYGILKNEEKQVLVSDEFIRGMKITKFPGGGLEAGEGTRDCLRREFMEEMNLKVEIGDHIYTTDHYMKSAFNPEHQIISIYYFVKALEPIAVPLRTKLFDFDEEQMKTYHSTGETETFRFIRWNDFSTESVTLPLDKIVAGMLNPPPSTMPPPLFPDLPILIEDNTVRLEPLEEHHYDLLLPVALHTELWAFTVARIKTKADFRNYFDTAMAEKRSSKSYPFAIYDKVNDEYAGSTRFANIEFEHRKLEIGWTWIRPSLQGTGFNRHCKFLLLSYCFETLGLNRVELKTSLLNLRSQKAMLKIGAVREGVLRKNIINDDGSIRDTVYFSFINNEWPFVKTSFFKELITD